MLYHYSGFRLTWRILRPKRYLFALQTPRQNASYKGRLSCVGEYHRFGNTNYNLFRGLHRHQMSCCRGMPERKRCRKHLTDCYDLLRYID